MPVYTAKIDDFTVDLLEITDTFPNKIGEYNYAFSDGVDMDYLGESARSIVFDVFFFQDQYDNHYNFLNHIRSGIVFQLSHPNYGLINGRIKDPSVTHNDGIEYCVINITFIEQKIGKEVEVLPDVIIEVGEYFVDGQNGSMDTVAIETTEAVGDTDAKNVLTTPLDPDESIGSQISGVSSRTRQIIANIDIGLGAISAEFSALEAPADLLSNTVDYGTNLPGRVAKNVTDLIDAYANAERKKNNLPSAFISSLNQVKDSFKTSLKRLIDDTTTFAIFDSCLDITTAQVGSIYISKMYDEDENQRDAHFKNIDKNGFDSLGNRIFNAIDIELYSVNELENSLYLIRELLGITLQLNRNSLKAHTEIGRSLSKHVDKIKLKRDTVVTVNLEYETPIHVQTLIRGQSHRNIYRILAINDIPNPTFAKGIVNLYE